ncbi:MAG: hypothetical protein DHS20C18_46310 [Saprospiraceae bacterium]|nr:MAG: hypothetical protein DHS20C18_46310 [Saprospiraceae bacterium]
MRTSLRDIQQIEAYLLKIASPEASRAFETRLLLEPELQEKLNWQKKAYTLIRNYGQKQLKAELETIHQKLFTEPEYAGFKQKIIRFFNPK